MISTTQADPLSGVFQRREGTGEAQIFNSGSFNPVGFWQRKAEQARIDREKQNEERKKKLANLNILGEYTPITKKGAEEIYGTYDKIASAYAEAMANGADIEDPTTEIGQAWIRDQGMLKGMIAGEKEINTAKELIRKQYLANPTKYDADVFAEAWQSLNDAPDIETGLATIREKTFLAPNYDPIDLVEQITREPDALIEFDRPSKKQIIRERYNDELLDEDINNVLANPQNAPYIEAYNRKLAKGEFSQSLFDFIKSQKKQREKIKESRLIESRGSKPSTSSMPGMYNETTKWGFDLYEMDDGNTGIVINRQGGENEPTPTIPMYIPPKDGDGEKTVNARVARIYKQDGKWVADIRYERKGLSGIVEQEETVPLDYNRNWSNISLESGFTKEQFVNAYNKKAGAGKQASSGKPQQKEKIVWYQEQ